jgi:hypothetical protein
MARCTLQNKKACSMIVLMAALAASQAYAGDATITEQVLRPLLPLSPAYQDMTGDGFFQRLLSIVRVAGQPAKSRSFWIRSAEFVRQYQKIGELWFSEKDETVVRVRLYGTRILTIDYRDYVINGAKASVKDDLERDQQMATQRSGATD